jgi:hypothetical protein
MELKSDDAARAIDKNPDHTWYASSTQFAEPSAFHWLLADEAPPRLVKRNIVQGFETHARAKVPQYERGLC